MKEKFVTFSGSEYIIDYDAKTWERKKGKNAATIRSDSGEYISLEFRDRWEFPDDGPCLYLVCPPINPPADRYIISTPIMERKYID